MKFDADYPSFLFLSSSSYWDPDCNDNHGLSLPGNHTSLDWCSGFYVERTLYLEFNEPVLSTQARSEEL